MKPAFPDIKKIAYEGPKSKNPLAFKHYNAEEVVEGKSMADHLRFGVAYWHTFRNVLGDPFGPGTAIRPWDDGSNSIENACNRARVAFEFIEKLGAPFYAFHDRDIAPEGATLAESNKNLDAVVKVLKEEQKRTGIKLLWGTANLFTNPRFMPRRGDQPECRCLRLRRRAGKEGAWRSPTSSGAAGYTFWGGREGYSSLWNTDLKREVDHLARFLHMAVDYKKQIGFTGPFYIEPKPKEPTKHQYDSDAAACLNFLREYDLLEHFKLNLETNHATLAGHTMHHELRSRRRRWGARLGRRQYGRRIDRMGHRSVPDKSSISQRRCMLVILKMGGFTTGGVNFDAKVRRESFEPIDLFHAHIGGMDAFARGLKIAAAIRADGRLAQMLKDRYSSWDNGIGASIEAGKESFTSLEKHALSHPDPVQHGSGRQELFENIVNELI